jgi:hypothetical protein
MTWQAQCYPQTVDDLKPVLALVKELGADHLNLQPDVRPYTLEECVPYIEGWRKLATRCGRRDAYRNAPRPHDHRPVLHPASAGPFPGPALYRRPVALRRGARIRLADRTRNHA